jgi:hypothetical protein
VKPDTARVGLYVQSLYDLDYPHNAFNIDFWMWFQYKNDSLEPLKSVEVANAKTYAYDLGDVEKKNGINWGAQKVKATIKQDWDIRDFPFDHQQLKIVLEDALSDTSSLIYIADTADSKIDERVKIDGWRISGLRLVTENGHYPTNYGDPTLSTSSTYPAVVAYIDLTRSGLGLFFKLFTGVYVAFSICMMTFFFDHAEIEARFSLLVGSLFAAVANKYIVDSFLPVSVGFALVDRIHVFTFIYILLSIVLSVYSMRLNKTNRSARARKTDRIALAVLFFSYALINGFYIYRAVK